MSCSTDARAARLRKFKREQLIVDYLNRGVSVAEIAARFDLGEKRMRAVIREILARRMPAPPEEFVAIQVSRLNEALLVAYGAMGDMNLRAVDRVVRIVRELDRYHGFVAAKRLPRTPSLEEPADALADARPEIALQDLESLENAPGCFATWETADLREPPPRADLVFVGLSAC
jgi:transposase-like protein